MRKRLSKLIRGTRGDYGWALICMAVLCIGLGLIVEYGRATLVRDHVMQDLEQCANITVQMAIDDKYRRDNISHMDIAKAQMLVYEYIEKDIGMKKEDANFIAQGASATYYINGLHISMNAEPASMLIEAQVNVPFVTFGDILQTPFVIKFPVAVMSRNQRLN